MKTTIVNQFYPPDLSPTGNLAASLAKHRAQMGDQVTVVSGVGYAQAEQDQADSAELHDTQDADAVVVRRVWTPQLGRASLWRRIIDYLVFFALTCWAMIRLPKQDAIICLTTPPFIVFAGALHKILHPSTRLILWNMDCYPEAAVRAGAITQNGIVSRLMQLSNRLLGLAIDHVVCLDDAMLDLVLSRRSGAQADKRAGRNEPERQSTRLVEGRASVITNWEALHSFPSSRTARVVERESSGEALVLYTGNMGIGHCFETFIEAAHSLHESGAPVRFVFTGGGNQTLAVKQQVRRRGLANVEFLGYVPVEKLRALQRVACCSLITLRDEMLGVMSPSKLHSSLAMGLPVLYVGPAGSNVDDAIRRHQCGASLRHGDTAGMVDFITRLRSDSRERAVYGDRARRAFELQYSDQHALPKFDQVIRVVVERDTRRAA